MNPRPIIVLGTGRSGTSTTARILHTRLGVCMGHDFDPPNKVNPLGYWEERSIEKISRRLAAGTCGPGLWLMTFQHSHDKHCCNADLIGYKHPNMCIVSRPYWEWINPLFVVKCWRDPNLVLASKNRISPTKSALVVESRKEFFSERIEGMEKGLVGLPVVTIDYTSRLTDDQVYEILRPHVEKWR